MALTNRCVFGTNLHFEDTEEILTMYGHTARVANLELHAGNYEYAKRSDTRRVFVLDRDDYRFMCLRKNIGVYEVPHVVGCLLGCLIAVEGDLIRFRIKEDDPSHLLMCCMDSAGAKEKAQEANPEALTDFPGHGVFFVVYSLSRKKTSDYTRPECYDNFYDDDPDGADVYSGRYDNGLDECSVIRHRLKISGF